MDFFRKLKTYTVDTMFRTPAQMADDAVSINPDTPNPLPMRPLNTAITSKVDMDDSDDDMTTRAKARRPVDAGRMVDRLHDDSAEGGTADDNMDDMEYLSPDRADDDDYEKNYASGAKSAIKPAKKNNNLRMDKFASTETFDIPQYGGQPNSSGIIPRISPDAVTGSQNTFSPSGSRLVVPGSAVTGTINQPARPDLGNPRMADPRRTVCPPQRGKGW